jgi:hypothetical protein
MYIKLQVQKSLQKLANDAKRKEVEWLQNDCEQLHKKIRVLSASSLKKGNKINEMLDSQLEASFESLAQR